MLREAARRTPRITQSRIRSHRRKVIRTRCAASTLASTLGLRCGANGSGPGPRAEGRGSGEHAYEILDGFEDFARSSHHGRKRIIRYVDGQLDAVADHRVEAFEHGASAGKHDAALEDLRAELGRGAPEAAKDRRRYLRHRIAERLAHVLRGDGAYLRDAADQVSALDRHLEFRIQLDGASNLALDALGRPVPDEQVVVSLEVLNDGVVQLVAAHANRLVDHDARERDDGDLRRAAADIDDHVADGLLYIQPDADCRRHGFIDEIDLPRTGMLCRVTDGTLFHLGDAARHADDHIANGGHPALLDLPDEPADELLGHLEIRDDAMLQGTNRFDLLVRALVHLLGFIADSERFSAVSVQGNNAWLVEHDTPPLDVDQRVGCPEIDCDVRRQVEEAHLC